MSPSNGCCAPQSLSKGDRPQERLDVEAITDAQRDRLDRALLQTEATALEIDLPAALR